MKLELILMASLLGGCTTIKPREMSSKTYTIYQDTIDYYGDEVKSKTYTVEQGEK
jgi:hypothetical protein